MTGLNMDTIKDGYLTCSVIHTMAPHFRKKKPNSGMRAEILALFK
jgi:hypothetical protein